ncbi:SRPBCC family protein [Marinactinospora thermotolerans]|uniref:Carbon monoxide dehydrogenase subunit G n=1 Tax=Marinactinospora thermotolerans DSM 45154 TaxID=1122192 RepID=A0A1T4LD17_9ACTN|nr:carbon monoxide dehydrogenase subunit G [Marinactinospora thermotolerans]SJZ52605.1 hypothetical protein SAMN02745673_00629 [Marinactinospora thermotolerans DSM 45154]
MKVTGNATLNAPVEEVWDTLLDPRVLARAIPGCEQLEATGPDRYRGTITAGVASIRGTFQGEVELADLRRPAALTLRAAGAGGPGTVRAEVAVRLADLGDGRTEVAYDADAVVGGMVGGVGQRVLAGVAKRMAGEFFAAIDGELAGRTAPEGAPVPAAGPDDVAHTASAPAGPRVPSGAGGAPVPAGGAGFVEGALVGAVIALVGVVVGAVVARRAGGEG